MQFRNLILILSIYMRDVTDYIAILYLQSRSPNSLVRVRDRGKQMRAAVQAARHADARRRARRTFPIRRTVPRTDNSRASLASGMNETNAYNSRSSYTIYRAVMNIYFSN